ncbi:PAS domain S-box-containing protein [Alteromonadaceae bacterium 2753L.S.0a.02]|nr:PAS domain S-box-containing protein [Alteromonadaceae bacterium 2753L.S.0a.02]
MARLSRTHRKSTSIGALIIVAITMLACIAGVADWANNRRFIQEQRLSVQNELATVRARLEGNINANLETVRGLVAVISVEPDMSGERFARLASRVIDGHTQLRNIGAAPNLVIKYVYPLKDNEAALGFDYRTSPEQWEAAKRARETGELTVAGPLQLRQGGMALIGRVPVFLSASNTEKGEFWGLVSAVIDLDRFYLASKLPQSKDTLAIAIKGRDGLLQNNEVFYGSPAVFESSPVYAKVTLPSGGWWLGAIPSEGWSSTAPSAVVLRSLAALMLLLLGGAGLLVFRLARTAELHENRLQSLFEFSPIGIALNDLETGDFLEVNAALVDPSGYTEAEFVNLSYWDLTPQSYQHLEDIQLASLKKNGRFGPYEKEYIRKNGERYPVLLNGVLVDDSSGKKCIWSIVEDISARKEAEKALVESRSQLQSFFDLSSNLMCIATLDGYFKLLNNAFLRVLGFSKTELKIEPFINFVHPDDLDATLGAMKTLEEKGSIAAFINRFRCKDGRYIFLHWSSTLDHQSGNIYATAMDVTREREHEAKLLRQQEMLESMSMLARIGAWEINLNDNAVYWSDMTKIIHEVGPEYKPTMHSVLKYYKSGRSLSAVEHAIQLCTERGTSFSEEVQITTAKGRDLWVLVTGKAEHIDEQCTRIYGSYQDINARKLIEKNIEVTQVELQQQMKMLRVIAQAQASFIEQSDIDKSFQRLLENILNLTSSQQGFIGEINYLESGAPYLTAGVFAGTELPHHYTAGVERVEFYNQDTLLGRAFVTLEPVIANEISKSNPVSELPEMHSDIATFLAIPITHGGRGIALVGLANRPGGYRQSLVSWLNPLMNTVAQFVLGARALNAREQAEQDLLAAKEAAELAAQAKSDFLAIMSHEIRTPLNGVMGMLGLLSRSGLNDEQQRKLIIAKQSSNTLLTIINDILDFSKVDAGKIELDLLDFNLISQLEEFAESMAVRAQEKNIEFIVDSSEIRDAMVLGDPGRIRQILTNLVSNAIKFTNRGEVVVRCSLTPTGDDMEFRVSVRDTGIGIPAGKIAELFNPFTQVDASTTRQFGGTGLGLAICKKLCTLMRGDVFASSEPGNGSEFEFYLRLKRSEKFCELPHVALSGKHIMVIDASATSCELVRSWGQRWGAEVTTAYNAEQALQISHEFNLQKRCPDALLIDQKLPVTGALELANQLSRHGVMASVPLIVMSRITDSDEQSFIKAGFRGKLAKPITPSHLSSCLEVVLAGGCLLSAHPAEDSTKQPQSRPVDLVPQGNAATRVLLVEDNPVNQDVAQMMLDDLGVVVSVAGNGIEALHALENAQEFDKFGLVLMDCQMPEMDGYEASRQIRAGKGGAMYQKVPIVAMTANAMKGDREKCLAAGMDDYISKPIDPNILEQKVEKWLANKAVLMNNAGDSAALASELEPNNNQDNSQWDASALLLAMKNRSDRVKILLNAFCGRMPDTLNEFKRAEQTADYEKIGFIAHSTKGSAGQLKAYRLQHLAEDLEQAVKDNAAEKIAVLSPQLYQESQQLLDVLNRYLHA